MSAHLLTNELPVEAMDWEHEKIEVWIDENRWEPFDFWDTHDRLIESATWAFEFMKQNFLCNGEVRQSANSWKRD